jgi:hypothetical protein
MLILGLILSVFAIGFLCWLLFTLAVYALPLFAAMMAGLAAYHHDAGLVGAFLVALLAGAATLAIGRLAFALLPSALLRTVVALVFAVPAAVAGYEAAFGLLHLGAASHAWCRAFGAIGSILAGATAFARMAVHGPSGTAGFVHPSATASAAGR